MRAKKIQNDTMSPQELRAASSIGLVMAIRMLGLFMILPVFTLFAENYQYVTATLIGCALGIYGLTQALFQIPFGIASDMWGRKPVILVGLALFIIGSMIAALAGNIYVLILGRSLQGAGAIGSVLMALLADSTRPQHRAKGMAIVGMSIGVSFSLALFLGSFTAQWLHLSGLFWLTAILSILAGLMVLNLLPGSAQPQPVFYNDWAHGQWRKQVWAIIKNKELLKLNASVFFLHIMLTALFVGLPVVLEMLVNHQLIVKAWECYLPVLIFSIIMAIPLIVIAEKTQKLKTTLMCAILMMITGLLVLWENYASYVGCLIGLWLFFSGFNTLEALLPSLVSRIAPKEAKGTALSFYSCAQFLGIFIGGLLGGWLYSTSYIDDLFLSLAALATIWLAIAYNIATPPTVDVYTLHLSPEQLLDTALLKKKLQSLPGIEAIQLDAAKGIAHLTINKGCFDVTMLRSYEAS